MQMMPEELDERAGRAEEFVAQLPCPFGELVG